MSKKKIYRSTITITVLHEVPSIADRTLGGILQDMDEDDLVGIHKLTEDATPIEGVDAVNALKEVGSDASFFNMDDEGNDFDDEEEEERDCTQCGNAFRVGGDGVSNHIDEDGDIDYDADADHTPY